MGRAGVVTLIGFVVVPVSPVLVTRSETGLLDGLKVRPVNVAKPLLAATVVVPPRVALDPGGTATETLPSKLESTLPFWSSTSTTSPKLVPATREDGGCVCTDSCVA